MPAGSKEDDDGVMELDMTDERSELNRRSFPPSPPPSQPLQPSQISLKSSSSLSAQDLRIAPPTLHRLPPKRKASSQHLSVPPSPALGSSADDSCSSPDGFSYGRSPKKADFLNDSDTSDDEDDLLSTDDWRTKKDDPLYFNVPTSSHDYQQDSGVDGLYTRVPDQPKGSEMFRDLLDTIAADTSTATGSGNKRRLVRKKDLDAQQENETGFGIREFSEHEQKEHSPEEMQTPEEIEEDIKAIEEAARRLHARVKEVKTFRREEVGRETESNPVDDLEVRAAAAGFRIPFALFNHDDESDLVLRRPGVPAPPPRRPIAHNPMADVTERMRGDQLLDEVAERKTRQVAETHRRWRLPGMKTALLDHQVLGVDWMVAQEMKAANGERRPHGGLVADAMGLGKTMQCIGTMITHPPEDEGPQVTLIVCPISLLPQWREEILRHTKKGEFNVFIHHGNNKIKDLRHLEQQDVVLASYGALRNSVPSPKSGERMSQVDYYNWYEGEYKKYKGIWHRTKFWRVILDESHLIRNRRSRTSIACQRLLANYTWCLTGTPLVNSLEDLYPFLNFVQHPQMKHFSVFKETISGKDQVQSAKRLQAVLKRCMMRRTKTHMLKGQPLIVLPKKLIRMVELEFDSEERALYDVVESRTRNIINKMLKSSKRVGSHYQSILVMLLRLRQICDHPYLLLQMMSAEFKGDDLECQITEFLNAPTTSQEAEALRELGADGMSPSSQSRKKIKDRAEALRPSSPEALSQDDKIEISEPFRRLIDLAKTIPANNDGACVLCSNAATNPVMPACRHVCCRDCIDDALEVAESILTCPQCQAPIREADIMKLRSAKPAASSRRNLLLSDEWVEHLPKPFIKSAKTIALLDQLHAWSKTHPGDKIVIFSQFVTMLDVIEHVLDEDDEGGWGVCRYQGNMTLSEREETLKNFRDDPELNIMLTSIKAGGVGLNLTCANLVISIDLWWNAATELQAFDRVHRLGQDKMVYVTRLYVRNTVEERMLQLQEDKLKMGKVVLGEGGAELGRLTMRELLGLFGDLEKNERTGRMEVRRRGGELEDARERARREAERRGA